MRQAMPDLEARLHDIHDMIYDPGNCLTPPRSILLPPNAPRKSDKHFTFKRKRKDNVRYCKKMKEDVKLGTSAYVHHLKKDIANFNRTGSYNNSTSFNIINEIIDDCGSSNRAFMGISSCLFVDENVRVNNDSKPQTGDYGVVLRNVNQQVYVNVNEINGLDWTKGDRLYLKPTTLNNQKFNLAELFSEENNHLCYLLVVHREFVKTDKGYEPTLNPKQHEDSGNQQSSMYRFNSLEASRDLLDVFHPGCFSVYSTCNDNIWENGLWVEDESFDCEYCKSKVVYGDYWYLHRGFKCCDNCFSRLCATNTKNTLIRTE